MSMVKAFCAVLVTHQLSKQLAFYTETLGLNLLFDNGDTLGLGIDSTLCIVLRRETNPNSHHQKENKGPIIMTFQMDIKDKTDVLQRLRTGGYTLRSMLELPEHNTEYHFIEDADGNELCLDFRK